MTREEAIQRLKQIKMDTESFANTYKSKENYKDVVALDMAIEALLVDRPSGEWIYHVDDLFPCESTQECSNCHNHQLMDINNDDFCPACGADMRGGSE